MAAVRIDYDRLISLSTGMICVSQEEDCIALIDEEARLVDSLSDIRGGISLARRKLNVVIARLRSDGHDDCEDGARNLKLLESTVADLG